MIHEPTVVLSKLDKKYHVWDGHRRVLACRLLEKGLETISEGKKVSYTLPSNWRIQIVKEQFWEDLKNNKKIEVRVSATDNAEPFTVLSFGQAAYDWMNTYAKDRYGLTYDPAMRKPQIRSELYDKVQQAFPSKKLSFIKNALHIRTKLESTREVKIRLNEALLKGIITESAISHIADTAPDKRDQIINFTIDAINRGATSEQINMAVRRTTRKIKNKSAPISKIKEVLEDEIKNSMKYKTLHINNLPIDLYNKLYRVATLEKISLYILCTQIFREWLEKNPPPLPKVISIKGSPSPEYEVVAVDENLILKQITDDLKKSPQPSLIDR